MKQKSHDPIITEPEIFCGENAPQLDGRASSLLAESGREMGHLRRLRIDVQIGSPFTQRRCRASDTLTSSPWHEEKEGSSPFPVRFSLQNWEVGPRLPSSQTEKGDGTHAT